MAHPGEKWWAVLEVNHTIRQDRSIVQCCPGFLIKGDQNSRAPAADSHFFASDFALSSSSVGGGSLPYLARYWAANFSLYSGWQMKHCESGRSCFSHQSPFAFISFATLLLHRAQTSSGTPCSAHHQALWSSCAALA